MSSISYAKNLSEVFNQIKMNKDIRAIAACTALKELPEISIAVRNIPELRLIEKRERRFVFGSAVTLSEILNLGEKNIPKVLYQAISTIANSNIRNIATIGGNICTRDFRHTLFSPLLAMDAKLTFRHQTVHLSKITEIPETAILTDIKIPVSEWTFEVFERFGPSHEISDDSGNFTFLANIESDQISNIKIAFASRFLLWDRDIESKLIGLTVPIGKDKIEETVSAFQNKFDEEWKKTPVKPILRKQFLNTLRFYLSEMRTERTTL